jgi:hypothetical protein
MQRTSRKAYGPSIRSYVHKIRSPGFYYLIPRLVPFCDISHGNVPPCSDSQRHSHSLPELWNQCGAMKRYSGLYLEITWRACDIGSIRSGASGGGFGPALFFADQKNPGLRSRPKVNKNSTLSRETSRPRPLSIATIFSESISASVPKAFERASMSAAISGFSRR